MVNPVSSNPTSQVGSMPPSTSSQDLMNIGSDYLDNYIDSLRSFISVAGQTDDEFNADMFDSQLDNIEARLRSKDPSDVTGDLSNLVNALNRQLGVNIPQLPPDSSSVEGNVRDDFNNYAQLAEEFYNFTVQNGLFPNGEPEGIAFAKLKTDHLPTPTELENLIGELNTQIQKMNVAMTGNDMGNTSGNMFGQLNLGDDWLNHILEGVITSINRNTHNTSFTNSSNTVGTYFQPSFVGGTIAGNALNNGTGATVNVIRDIQDENAVEDANKNPSVSFLNNTESNRASPRENIREVRDTNVNDLDFEPKNNIDGATQNTAISVFRSQENTSILDMATKITIMSALRDLETTNVKDNEVMFSKNNTLDSMNGIRIDISSLLLTKNDLSLNELR